MKKKFKHIQLPRGTDNDFGNQKHRHCCSNTCVVGFTNYNIYFVGTSSITSSSYTHQMIRPPSTGTSLMTIEMAHYPEMFKLVR